MGRAPCCAKVGLKRGRWTEEEDEILKKYIQVNGTGSWRSLPKNAGLPRCGKSCRLRWINYLRNDLRRGNISPEEEELIIKLHSTLGNRWSQIACHFKGRTDNEIKNYWNSNLSRRALPTFRFHRNETFPPSCTTLPPPPAKRKGRGRISRAAMKKNKEMYTSATKKPEQGIINNSKRKTPLLPLVLEGSENRNQIITTTLAHNNDDSTTIIDMQNSDVSTSGMVPIFADGQYTFEQDYEDIFDGLEIESNGLIMNLGNDSDVGTMTHMEKEINNIGNNDLLSCNNYEVDRNWRWDWDCDWDWESELHNNFEMENVEDIVAWLLS